MNFIIRNIVQKGAVVILLTWGSILCFGAISVSDDFTDRRITAGAKIFRALLAADADIAEKKNKDDELRLCLVYENDWRNAKLSSEILHSRSVTEIRGIKVRPEFALYSELIAGEYGPCTGIFLTQQLSDAELAKLIEFSQDKQIVLFSPFEGDVERGVLGGIKVESRLLPYINVKAVKEANINLKSFFMKVAKTYEE